MHAASAAVRSGQAHHVIGAAVAVHITRPGHAYARVGVVGVLGVEVNRAVAQRVEVALQRYRAGRQGLVARIVGAAKQGDWHAGTQDGRGLIQIQAGGQVAGRWQLVYDHTRRVGRAKVAGIIAGAHGDDVRALRLLDVGGHIPHVGEASGQAGCEVGGHKCPTIN